MKISSKSKHCTRIHTHIFFFVQSRTIKKESRENLTREKKLLEIQKQEELNNFKQSIDREKEELKKKLQ